MYKLIGSLPIRDAGEVEPTPRKQRKFQQKKHNEKGIVMIRFNRSIRAIIIALGALSLPCSLMAKPIVVSINDTPSDHAVVQVNGAPNGWTVVPDDPALADSGIITLIGVDVFGSINEPEENGWRFTDPNAPQSWHASADIIWIQHDWADTGYLQVGFDSAGAGQWFNSPGYFNSDADAGPITDNWVTLYSDDTLVLQYKPHTNR
jgi:hypothetical protein